MALVEAVMSALGLGVLAILYAFLAKQGREGSVPRNGSWGIRTRTTRRSDEAWNAAHHAASPALKTLAVVLAAFAALLVVLGAITATSQPSLITAVAFIGYALGIGGLLLVVTRANRAARQAQTELEGHTSRADSQP